jgi:hypothetical protein
MRKSGLESQHSICESFKQRLQSESLNCCSPISRGFKPCITEVTCRMKYCSMQHEQKQNDFIPCDGYSWEPQPPPFTTPIIVRQPEWKPCDRHLMQHHRSCLHYVSTSTSSCSGYQPPHLLEDQPLCILLPHQSVNLSRSPRAGPGGLHVRSNAQTQPSSFNRWVSMPTHKLADHPAYSHA